MAKRTHILGIFLFPFIFFTACALHSDEPIQKVCFEKQCFTVELAQTMSERVKGLQNRASLDSDKGMLFIFKQSLRHSFWMKDTLIALDILWLDEQKRIVSIRSNLPPCPTEPCPTYVPDADAFYVLEINAGLARELGLQIGNQAVFE